MSSFWRHAVDTPMRLAIIIADGNAESSIVGANDLNVRVLLALDHQLLPLACVASPDDRCQIT